MNRNNLPLLLMLTAGAVTCVITMVRKYSALTKMVSLLVVLLVFYGLGCIIKWTLNYFEEQNLKKSQAEGEVIEKEAQPEEDLEGIAEGAPEA